MRSQLEPRRAEDLVRTCGGVDHDVRRRRDVLGEDDVAAAADAVPQRAQPVGCRGAVPDEPAALTTGCRLAVPVQRAAKVPSRCASAFAVVCAAGSAFAVVCEGACAYG